MRGRNLANASYADWSGYAAGAGVCRGAEEYGAVALQEVLKEFGGGASGGSPEGACPILLRGTARIAIIAVMKSVTALEAKNRLGEVLEAAQRQPVSITRNGRPSVVVISAESYARRQRMARERMRQALQRAGEHAVAQGMNEDVLDQLLADES